MKKKLICIFLFLLLVLPLINACDDDDNDISSTGSADEIEELGLEPRNFNGKTISLLTVEGDGNIYSAYEFATNETDGSKIKDAVFNRTQKLKEDYGINLEVAYDPTPTASYKNSIHAGDNTHQLISDSMLGMMNLGNDGHLHNLNNVPNLNLSKEWWDQSVIDDLSLAGKRYFLAGDFMISDKNATWCCFFNKDLIDEYALENPYELVKSDEWTIDKLYEMAKVVSEGNKGLSEVTWENGTFGLLTQTYDAIASMVSFNQKMITKDSNDYPELNIQNEATYDKFTKIYDVIMDKNTSLVIEFSGAGEGLEIYENGPKVFLSGRALFTYNRLQYVQDIMDSNADFKYGSLPMPKYDINQDEYYTTCTVYWAQVVSIPITVPEEELDAVGYLLEVMGYYGKELVKPAYYDETIKLQKMDDQESEEMLDIIFANRIFDWATLYDNSSALQLYTNILISRNNTIASSIEAQVSALQVLVDEHIKAINKIDEK